MGRISPQVKQEVLARAAIEAVVGDYVALKRAGATYKARCPFHEERTPSFVVDPRRGSWRCFGACSEGGDAISFVMKIENVSYPEAVRKLAARVGVVITESPASAQDREEPGERDRLFATLAFAADFFFARFCDDPAAEAARAYVESRGITAESVNGWRLGYAPDSWDALLSAAREKGFSDHHIEKAGLAKRSEKSGYLFDFFRGRLIFPITDPHDRVIGFGARRLGDDDETAPKYINTPETPLFHKGTNVYGLARARRDILKERRALIMEGYTDVIMAHQHAIRTAVAPLGTALTREQVQVLRRVTDEMVVVFDGDEPGQKSAEGKLPYFLEEGCDPRLVTLPDGQDPCDFLRASGADAFLAQVDGARWWGDFLVMRLLARHDLADPLGRQRASEEALELVRTLSSPVQRDIALQKLSGGLGVSEEALRQRLLALVRRDRVRAQFAGEARASGAAVGPTTRPADAPAAGSAPGSGAASTAEAAGDRSGAAETAGARASAAGDEARARHEAALLAALLWDDQMIGEVNADFPPERFRDRAHGRLFERLVRRFAVAGSASYADFVAVEEDEALLALARNLRSRQVVHEEARPEVFVRDTLDWLLRDERLRQALALRRRQPADESEEVVQLAEVLRLRREACGKSRQAAEAGGAGPAG
ncbi:MAG: DNA primase [Planctomycetes bacterium]|nr:DNA primase [Planctomycetota bacterium]